MKALRTSKRTSRVWCTTTNRATGERTHTATNYTDVISKYDGSVLAENLTDKQLAKFTKTNKHI